MMSDHLQPSQSESVQPIKEITIPQDLRSVFKTGTERIEKTIFNDKPDLIVTLDRSGTLLWNNFSVPQLENHGIKTQENTIHSPIGREISDRFCNEYGIDPYNLFDDAEAQRNYYQWLKTDAQAQNVVHKLTNQLIQLKKQGKQIENLLVVDDCPYQWTTLGLTTPWMVQEALKQSGYIHIDDSQSDDYLLENENLLHIEEKYGLAPIGLGSVTLQRKCISTTPWLERIQKESFPNLYEETKQVSAPGALSGVMHELMKGQIEYQESADPVPVTWETAVQKGAYLQQQFRLKFNPALVLEEKYGRNQLFKLHELLEKGLQEASKK